MNIPGADPKTAGEALSPLLLENIRDYAVFALDREGRVQSWSAPTERLLGYPEQDIIGQPVARLYGPEDVADGVPARELEQAQRTGRVDDARWYRRQDDTWVWSEGVTTPLLAPDGVLCGFAKVMRDRTAVKQAEAARDTALAYADSIVETVREPLLVLDAELRVQRANRAFYRTFEVAPADTEGQCLYALGNGQWEIPRMPYCSLRLIRVSSAMANGKSRACGNCSRRSCLRTQSSTTTRSRTTSRPSAPR
jgi:PAS domain S-box-containing protein